RHATRASHNKGDEDARRLAGSGRTRVAWLPGGRRAATPAGGERGEGGRASPGRRRPTRATASGRQCPAERQSRRRRQRRENRRENRSPARRAQVARGEDGAIRGWNE